MSPLGKEQKGQQLHSNHHWGRGCQADEGLSTVSCTKILDRKVCNWERIRWSSILWDKQLELERGLCKNNQEGK